MTNVINIVEKGNRLDFEDKYTPIVCGNSNYSLKFSFGESFKKCDNKTAMFVVEGKKILVEFKGEVCKVPVMPNCNSFLVAIFSASETGEQLSTTFLRIRAEASALGEDFSEFDNQLKKYVSTIIGAVNSLENGTIVCKQAEIANNVSNPNLLINGNFKVNQRGESTYSIAGRYTVDRWRLVNGSVSVASNGIVLNGTISQTLEYQPTETVTPSVDNSAGGVSCSYLNGVFKITATNKLVKWAKLEVGTTPTPFSPKLYAEELALCQRFCLKLASKTNYGTICLATEQTESAYTLFVPHQMRTNPSIASFDGSFNPQYNTSGTSEITVSSINVNQFSEKYIVLIMNIKEKLSFTYGKLINMRSLNNLNTYILLDAEIY